MSDFRFVDQSDEVLRKLNSSALRKADQIGDLVLNQILRGMSKGHSGKTRVRGGRAHTASAPGEYPAIDSGDFYNDLQVETSAKDGEATAAIGTTLDYPGILEGNPAGSGIRPWLSKAYFEVEGQIMTIVQQGWEQ